MFKKYIAILFVSLACAILFVHNITPHYHHDEVADPCLLGESHLDETCNTVNHLFSHLLHLDSEFYFTNSNESSNYPSLNLILATIGNSIEIPIDLPLLLSSIHWKREKPIIRSSIHALSKGMRAPPAILG